jgi:hypothetical protein
MKLNPDATNRHCDLRCFRFNAQLHHGYQDKLAPLLQAKVDITLNVAVIAKGKFLFRDLLTCILV